MSFVDVVYPAFLFIVGMAIPFAINARLVRGDSGWAVQRHILYRAFALVVMGVFMVNAEEGFNERAMPISIHLWSLLFYLAVFLAWGVLRFAEPTATRWMRLAGVALLVALALVYRGGDDGGRGMVPQWWGILGLIGWAYFVSSELYLLARGRLPALVLCLAACVAYYTIAHQATLAPAIKWLFSQDAHAAHSSIVLSGVICTLIFFDAERSDSNRRRFAEAAVLALVLALVAWLLRPVFGISKIYATPSWCLYCAALCVVLFAALYGLIDVRRHGRWTRWVEPAASSPLVTYLIPFIVVALLALTGWSLPAVLRDGWGGLAYAAAYAALVVWVVSLLNRRGIRLQI
jgi:predicted acyltransferase